MHEGTFHPGGILTPEGPVFVKISKEEVFLRPDQVAAYLEGRGLDFERLGEQRESQ